MNIQIIDINKLQKGIYTALMVDYKNLEKGYVSVQRVMSFQRQPYNVLKDAKNGQKFNVQEEKDKKNYTVWVSASEEIS